MPAAAATPDMILADLLDTLLHAALLGGIALALGGVAWGGLVVQGWRGDQPHLAVRRCLALAGTGAALCAVAQVSLLGVKAHVLAASLGPEAPAALATTASSTCPTTIAATCWNNMAFRESTHSPTAGGWWARWRGRCPMAIRWKPRPACSTTAAVWRCGWLNAIT